MKSFKKLSFANKFLFALAFITLAFVTYYLFFHFGTYVYNNWDAIVKSLKN